MAVGVYVDDKYFYALNPYGYDNSVELEETEESERHYFFDEVNHSVLLIGWITILVNYNNTLKNETFWII